MKNMVVIASFLTLMGCANNHLENKDQNIIQQQSCIGTSALPANIESSFDAIEDDLLLQKTLGNAQQGALCQGQVYQSKEDSKITVHRSWNSTNPKSTFGKWWAFDKPSGATSQYRSDYEICYQWSPLDRLVSCTLKGNTKIVVGTGQSAQCSQYLSYPVSAKQQVYIDDAINSVVNCAIFSDEFHWK